MLRHMISATGVYHSIHIWNEMLPHHCLFHSLLLMHALCIGVGRQPQLLLHDTSSSSLVHAAFGGDSQPCVFVCLRSTLANLMTSFSAVVATPGELSFYRFASCTGGDTISPIVGRLLESTCLHRLSIECLARLDIPLAL